MSVALSDREGAFGAEAVTRIAFDYADGRTNDLQPRDIEVDRAVAQAFATRARLEALEMNRSGRFGDAAASLDAVAKRIRGYAGSDPDLLRIAGELETDRPTMAAPMMAMEMKTAFFVHSSLAAVDRPRARRRRGRGGKRDRGHRWRAYRYRSRRATSPASPIASGVVGITVRKMNASKPAST